MTHTSSTTLVMAALIGGVLGWAGQWALVSSGNPALIPPLTWGVAVAALGAVILALAWPIRTQVRAQVRTLPVDPFYATRVVLLAQAGAIAGSTLTGVALGCVVFFLGRPVLSSEGLWLSGLAVVGAIVLGVCALIAERWCTLPPDSSDPGAVGVPEGEAS